MNCYESWAYVIYILVKELVKVENICRIDFFYKKLVNMANWTLKAFKTLLLVKFYYTSLKYTNHKNFEYCVKCLKKEELNDEPRSVTHWKHFALMIQNRIKDILYKLIMWKHLHLKTATVLHSQSLYKCGKAAPAPAI